MEIKKLKYVRYGIGGFDDTKPNNNILEQYEYDEPPIPKIEKIKLLVYLLRIEKYKLIINNLNKLTEEQLIVYNHSEHLEIGTPITNALKGLLGVNDLQLQAIFNRANEVKI
jgi:hypothetical protein